MMGLAENFWAALQIIDARKRNGSFAPADSSEAYICTYDAARARGVHPSTFRRRATKVGVRHRMGRRIWDGYTWNADDLARLMPLNSQTTEPGSHNPNHP